MTPAERVGVLARTAAGPPPPGEYVELAAGILWIRLPIPGALRHINVWLVPAARGWFLVDTGMHTAAVAEAWSQLARRLPLASELESIVVTHHHPDHFGMAHWLSDRFGIGVAMSERAAAAAANSVRERPAGEAPPADGFALRTGLELDAEMNAIIRGRGYQSIVSGMPALQPLHPDQPLRGTGPGWRISIHDGHAPGHACLHDDSAHILISGDQVLPTISSNISLYPSDESADPLGDYLASLHRLAVLPQDTLVLPAHGLPFATLHARLAALRDEHAGRLQTILDCCSQPLSTAAVTGHLFRMERLDALNRLLATTETLAHLRRLELQGEVERRGQGPELRWSKTSIP